MRWTLIILLIGILSCSTGVEEIEDAKDEYKIVLVDFWADGCHACAMIEPFIEEIEDEYPEVKVLSVDINGADSLNQKYNIRFIPNVIIFYNGEEYDRLIGYHEKIEYTNILDELIKNIEDEL